MRRSNGFTLLELLAVVAIMGLLASASIGSYRTMRQGMEERGVLQNATQFLRIAYQRSRIDSRPVVVYVWNETAVEGTDETEAKDETEVKIFGRAVAVRKMGYLTRIQLPYLIDEFGDFSASKYTNADGEEVEAEPEEFKNGVGGYLYKMNGDETGFHRSIVSQVSTIVPGFVEPLISDSSGEETTTIDAYGLYLISAGNINWQVGDAYGMEFDEIELPAGYIFGDSYSESATDPVKPVEVIRFNPMSGDSGAGATLKISAVRLNEQGNYAVKRIDYTGKAGAEDNK